jgi:hypothetical protein
VDILRVLGLCGVAGANRPNRLVGNHQRRQRSGVEALDCRFHLAQHDVERLASLPLLQALAYAQDWHDVVRQQGGDLFSHTRVGFAEELTPLRVTNDAVPAAHVDQKRGAEFARPGARIFPVRVLCRQPNCRTVDRALHGRERGRDWSKDHVASRLTAHMRGNRDRQCLRLVHGIVQLPVACDQRFAVGHD